ncbi:MAG TPA: SdrD B-like domain-containing protein [Lacipirellulaceae bacterium]
MKSIVIHLKDGNDYVSLDSVANGGAKVLQPIVTVYSGSGTDSVHVRNGHDSRFSGIGHTLVVSPNGTATLDGAAVNWTPPAATLVTLSGTKWEDHNGNAVRDSGDQGLAGWHILVNGVDRATTDASGNWSVANLTAGNYTVQEVTQSGWTQTSSGSGYTLSAAVGQSIGNLSFGDFKNITLSGAKWEDHNGDGLWQNGDQGLAGWHILINGVDRAITDANGNWSVANLGPGSYTVQEVAQAGWTKTAGTTGYTLSAASGQSVTNLSFADFKNITLSGMAWEDHNGNAVRDSGDQGLAGWHILVNGVDRAITDANGNWSVANLGPGSYTVQEVAQAGWTKTAGTTGYTLSAASGQSVTNLSFADFKNITLSGMAWEDHNGDGLWQSGDQGFAGWHVLINGVDRASTDVNGNWSVSNLGPGSYTVQEVAQSTWTQTYGGAGYSLSASSGADAAGLNFGEFYNVAPPPPSTNWFDAHVSDVALRALGHNLYTDNLIDRNDMIALLREAEDGSAVDATELVDLRAIVANASLFGTLDYVDQLAADVVNGSAANASYQGQSLGNLAANSSATQLDKLINKWFLGLDRPNAVDASQNLFPTYRQFSGSLFVGGADYTDVRQGYLGDCYFVCSLAETALLDNSAITNMFIVNGDGTYTVKFFNSGQPVYVTVDSYLPTDTSGRAIYAGPNMVYTNAGNELWVALAEKGYVQLNELGWERAGQAGSGQNIYSAIEGGSIWAGLGQVTGHTTAAYTMTTSGIGLSSFVTAFNAGELIGFASKGSPASSSVVGSHAYAVVGYNAATGTVTLFNPWGIQYGLLTLNWAQIQMNFDYFDRTA